MKTGLRIAVILKRQEREGSVRSRRKGSWEKWLHRIQEN